MSPETKDRVTTIMTGTRVVFYYGFIPTILILGFMKGADEGNPPLSPLSLLWQ